ncbi:spore germination protein [Paenibacillus glycanilyticus]|uniref:GerAB/ArcD/ProY family transporter n=1 Tax=Paenibacillus glycanilyticus TaxID=126569 RepID=UPI00203E6789|nr:GerAB/ArcD/ProY family transporter [Paenibacillus glycanilyticus]MCM3626650.1 spore germination protein [Paenibacillus glycanilyticus]
MNISITKNQLFFLIIKTQIGIGLLSLPSVIQHSAGGDAWISVLGSGLAIQLLILVYWHLCKRYPGMNLSEMTIVFFGSYIGRSVNAIYYCFFVIIAGYACTLYVRLIKVWLLPLTPGWVLLLLIIGVSIYLALEDLRVIARFYQLAAVLFVLLFVISLATFSNDIHLSNILPVGQSDISQIISGSEKTFFAMLGFEVILYFSAQVKDTPSGILKTITMANWFVTLFYSYFVFICLIGFSQEALSKVKEPVLFLLRGLTFQLFDRLDLIFLTIWIIPMSATIVSYFCLAGKSLATSKKGYQRLVWISGLLVLLVGSYLYKQENMESISQWIEYGYLLMIVAVPLLMWILSFLFRSRHKRRLT